MTKAAQYTLLRDASTVYAEGVVRGLVMAMTEFGKVDDAAIPPKLKAMLREWQAHVIHREWLAGQGRPLVDLVALPTTAEQGEALNRARTCPHCKLGFTL
jgi:hypothetical protein